uniref:Progestin and adipoQ receptor family member 3 n=1 Tax=Photinus pyralis TaxID=7054 RepID=A0A1Y1KK67_PHOPY
MTVSIPPKCDVSKTDTNDNETCCTNKNDTSTDHTGSLLSTCDDDENVNDPILEESESKCKKEICEHHKPNGEMRLYSLKDAPEYLQHNVFILTGYRGILNTKLCIESIFWWTNETINIWSHLFGWLLFVGLTIYDLSLLNLHASFLDKLCVAMLLICFQVCMGLSAVYHTFSCRSEDDCNYYLSLDLFGIALSLLAIYMSGIYYAFWCHQAMLNFYLVTIFLIFCGAMALQHPKLNANTNVKMFVFVLWAAYGIVPTIHWTFIMGGFANPLVSVRTSYVLTGIYRSLLDAHPKGDGDVLDKRYRLFDLLDQGAGKVLCRKIRLFGTLPSVVAFVCSWRTVLLAQYRNNVCGISNESWMCHIAEVGLLMLFKI